MWLGRSAWAEAWGIDPEYWAERQFGNRICSWLSDVLTNDPTAEGYLAGLKDTLIRGVDCDDQIRMH